MSNPKSLLSRVPVLAALSALYLLISYWLIGFRPEQLVLVGVVNTLYFASPATRGYVKAFSIFLVYWIIFDYMKAIPNYRFSTVHIESIYNLEKKFFGIHQADGVVLTPNEYFQLHTRKWADFLSGIFYLCWIPVPLGFATYLYIKKERQYYYFALTFLLVNCLGFIVYYSCPAAPPWYVSDYGFGFNADTIGNTAGLARFDTLIGIPVFQGIYTKSSNVFAAMPSLHSAYPVIVVYYAFRNKIGFMRYVLASVMVGIWCAAIYSNHHYVLDVLAGILCAVIGIWLFNKMQGRWAPEKALN